jgi:carbamoyl-phosphate synthase large subunit
MSQEQIFEYTAIDPWFLAQLGELHAAEQWMRTRALADLGPEDFLQIKKRGFSDVQIARAVGVRPALFRPLEDITICRTRHCPAEVCCASTRQAAPCLASSQSLMERSEAQACMQRVGSCLVVPSLGTGA